MFVCSPKDNADLVASSLAGRVWLVQPPARMDIMLRKIKACHFIDFSFKMLSSFSS